MNKHIQLLGWLHILANAVFVLIAGVVFAAVTWGGLLSGDVEALVTASTAGTLIAGFFLLLAAPGMVGGVGLLRRRSWARPLVLVLGFFQLFNFPLGTALGFYTFWVLLQEESARILSG